MVEPAPETYMRGRTPTQFRPESAGSDESSTPSPKSDNHVVEATLSVDGSPSANSLAGNSHMSGDERASSRRGSSYSRGRGIPPSPRTPNPQLHVHPLPAPYGQPYQSYGQPSQPYGAQYTMHPQSPVPLAHPPGFVYPNPYTIPGNNDPAMAQNYPQLVQPHVYPYQGSSSASPNPPQPYQPQMFARQDAPPLPPHSPPPPTSPTFQPNRFTPQYQYSTRLYPTTGVYPTQYASNPYSQPFPPQAPDSSESSQSHPQGSWWYLMPSQQQFDQNQYQQPYPLAYPPPMSPASPASAGVSQQILSLGSPTSPPVSQPQSPLVRPPSSISSAASSRRHSEPAVPTGATGPKHPTRRAYHPNPPSHRSEFVMWVGNVPQDATHDELWRFFNQVSSPGQDSSSSASPPVSNEPSRPPESPPKLTPGVLSIFLISRSSCAFVNFETEVHLTSGISRFNGRPLRPADHRCPRLVCRVRRKEDDLRAGVGGQRGIGMHTKWVKDQRRASSVDHDSDGAERRLSLASISSDEPDGRVGKRSTGASSGSYASTTSSFLTRHFPRRYFILKSLSQFDVDLSVEKGLWATQKHNEGILDQAFRTSKEVFLIFGVNKSGEFYGYARMVGPIRQGENRVSWASRSSTSSSRSEEKSPKESSQPWLSPSDERLVDESPGPLELSSAPTSSHATQKHLTTQSAPPVLGTRPRSLSKQSPDPASASLNQIATQQIASASTTGEADNFHLDPEAPLRAIKNEAQSRSSLGVLAEDEEEEKDKKKGKAKDNNASATTGGIESWGESFKVHWIRTNRLPFFRTRHLRNPWNHDREVKVSRDGTELEPTVGQMLLEEWDKLEAEGGSLAAPQSNGGGSGSSTSPTPPGSTPLQHSQQRQRQQATQKPKINEEQTIKKT